jgi:energy-coupling factor transporter ATP-binding protein EcfA2
MGRPTFRIEELHIRSFRGIEELHLAFPVNEREPGGLVVLAGDNGCGKTAVLESILLVLGRVDLLPADTATLAEQVRLGAADFEITAKLRTPGFTTEVTELRVTSKTLTSPTRPGPAGEVPNGPFWETVLALQPNVEYFSARREPEDLGETPDPRGARAVREARRVVELKRKVVSAYYRSLRAGQGGKMPADSPFARLQAFVQRFLGEDTILDVLPVSNDPGSGDDVVIRKGEIPADVTSLAMVREVASSRKDVPLVLPIDRLSSGQVALFAFAGPLLYRDVPADLVLIDEPEQHLHVQWQGALVHALREITPPSQIVMATHSLDVADRALSYERFLLLPEGDPRLSRGSEDRAAE